MRFCGKCGTPLNRAELAKSSIETQEMRNDIQDIKRLISQYLSSPSAAMSEAGSLESGRRGNNGNQRAKIIGALVEFEASVD